MWREWLCWMLLILVNWLLISVAIFSAIWEITSKRPDGLHHLILFLKEVDPTPSLRYAALKWWFLSREVPRQGEI